MQVEPKTALTKLLLMKRTNDHTWRGLFGKNCRKVACNHSRTRKHEVLMSEMVTSLIMIKTNRHHFCMTYSAIHQAAGSLATGRSPYRWENGLWGSLRPADFWNSTSGNRETTLSPGASGLVNRAVSNGAFCINMS